MKRMMVAAMVASAGLLVSGCGMQQARFTRTDTLSQPHQSGAALDVQVANGSIEVSRGGEAVSIEAKIRAMTQERLDATHMVATRESDGTLNIRIDWPDGGRKGNEGCSLAIELPDAAEIELVTSNGSVTVDGVGTGATLRTSNGAIRVARVSGKVEARTSNGRVEISDVSGKVHAESSNGAIELARIGGAVDATTSNGDVKVGLNDECAGPLAVHTSNGSVRVEVGTGFRGALSVGTSNGRVHAQELSDAELVNVGKTSATVRFSGEGSSRISTSNGSVTVTRVPKE